MAGLLDPEMLLDLAVQAAESAYAPYSDFHVGAVLLGADGGLYSGCNMENAAYGLSLCAERAAVATAVRAGERRFVGLAIVGARAGQPLAPCPPCGACRQVLAEFCGPDLPIWSRGADAEIVTWTLGALLPQAFALAGQGPDGGTRT